MFEHERILQGRFHLFLPKFLLSPEKSEDSHLYCLLKNVSHVNIFEKPLLQGKLITLTPRDLALIKMESRSSTAKAMSLTPSPWNVRCCPISKVSSELGSYLIQKSQT